MIFVFDSSAVIALVRDEPGADEVETLLASEEHECFIHALNMCEVYYDHVRRDGRASARRESRQLQEAGLRVRHDIDAAFYQMVGDLKAERRRVSLADCFCAVLAQHIGGEVVTCDHHEFDPLDADDVVRVRFLR